LHVWGRKDFESPKILLMKEGYKMNLMMRLFKEEDGQGMTEYALIIGIIAVVLIGTLALFKDKLVTIFEGITNSTEV
jgi:pilus assembly protein Flp/PilA